MTTSDTVDRAASDKHDPIVNSVRTQELDPAVLDVAPQLRIIPEEVQQAAVEIVISKPVETIAKKEQQPVIVADTENKPKPIRSVRQVTAKAETVASDEPIRIAEVVVRTTPNKESSQVKDEQLSEAEPAPSKPVREMSTQEVTDPAPNLFELAAAELGLPVVESVSDPEPGVDSEIILPLIEQSAADVQRTYAEHTPEELIVSRLEAVLTRQAETDADISEVIPEKVEQITHFVAAMPEGVSEAIVVKFEAGEPEEVAVIEQLVGQLASAADRLHDLAMIEQLDGEEAVQIEALVEVWYAELCEAIGVIVSPEDFKQFITLVKSAEYKLISDEQTQETAVTIDHEAWYNPHYDFTGLAHGQVAGFIRQQLHSRLGGLSVKALVV